MKQVSIKLDEQHENAVDKYREVVRAQMGYAPTRPQAVKALMNIGVSQFMQPFLQQQRAAEVPAAEDTNGETE